MDVSSVNYRKSIYSTLDFLVRIGTDKNIVNPMEGYIIASALIKVVHT